MTNTTDLIQRADEWLKCFRPRTRDTLDVCDLGEPLRDFYRQVVKVALEALDGAAAAATANPGR